MDSIVNYESDDGNVKISNKTSAKDSTKNKEKRRHSSDDDSSDGSSSSRNRKRLIEDDRSNRKSPSPRKSTHKSTRSDKYKSHDHRSERHRQRSSSRDSDRHERKKRKNDDRDDKKRHWQRSKEHEKRSESRDRDDHSSKDRHRDRSSERRKERYDDRKRHNRRENERRYDDDKDYGRRREEPNYRSGSRNANDSRSNSSSSNSSSAIRRAEALNRTIERRANEKVQQLQKLGIELPALMQQQHIRALNQQAALIHPISTSIASGGLLPNPSASNENTNIEPDNLTLNLSNFTSPVLTNARYTEQMQKKKLIWGAKKTTPTETVTTNNKWEAAKFSQDSDGKMASKFLRLMGMKNAPATANASDDNDTSVEKREEMFTSMEHQYEVARQATHTMRGMGLGFGHRPC